MVGLGRVELPTMRFRKPLLYPSELQPHKTIDYYVFTTIARAWNLCTHICSSNVLNFKE